MDKADKATLYWAALSTVYIGGILLYFAGVKPRTEFSSEIIPVDEPSLVDWATIGGMMFITA